MGWVQAGFNKRAFFSLEAMLGMLMLALALSWVITAIMKAQVVNDNTHQEAVVRSHADFIFAEIDKIPKDRITSEVRKGHWNYPNPPSIVSVGMIPLHSETIITEIPPEDEGRVRVTIRWINLNGETKTAVYELLLGGG